MHRSCSHILICMPLFSCIKLSYWSNFPNGCLPLMTSTLSMFRAVQISRPLISFISLEPISYTSCDESEAFSMPPKVEALSCQSPCKFHIKHWLLLLRSQLCRSEKNGFHLSHACSSSTQTGCRFEAEKPLVC